MGYEVNMYVGRLFADGGEEYYLDQIASVDVCSPGYDSGLYRLSNADSGPYVYFYGTDGNTRYTTDCYDKRLTAINIDTAIDALERDCENDNYVRLHIALHTLLAVKKGYPDAVIVLYGY